MANGARRAVYRTISALLGVSLTLGGSVAAADLEEHPVPVAPGVYALIGSTDEASPDNAGVVGNSGFIVGETGTIVVNTGSSYAHGKRLIELAERTGAKPVVLAILTQPLQEFVMGSAAFAERGIPVLAHETSAQLVTARCETCLKNLKRMLGEDAMRGTQVLKPPLTVGASENRSVAGRRLKLWHGGWGVTPGDLVVVDLESGVAFTGALLSVHRIPELRDANLPGWRRALEGLGALPIRRVVPGYGPVADLRAVAPQRAYFDALERQAKGLLGDGSSLLDASQHSDLPAYEQWDLYAKAHPRNLQQTYLRLEAAGVGR